MTDTPPALSGARRTAALERAVELLFEAGVLDRGGLDSVGRAPQDGQGPLKLHAVYRLLHELGIAESQRSKGDRTSGSEVRRAQESALQGALASAVGTHSRHGSLELSTLLAVTREHVGTDVVFLTHFRESTEAFLLGEGDIVSFGPIHEGAELPLDQTYCERVIKNFVPGVIPDTAQEDLVRRLDVTEQADIGSYVAIPIHLSDGTLYGTLCCLSHAPGKLLDEQDLRFARLLGMLAAHQIERQNLTDALLRTQHAVHRALSRARTVDEVAVEILSAIGSPLGYESVVLWSVGRRAGELRAAARWSRLDGGASDTGTASPPARAPAAVAQARETARPVAEAMVLAVPLTCDDAVVGVLEFSRGDRHQTDERTLAFLVELAASIGRALRPLSGWAASGPLTAREREVLQLMADGLNLQQTAARLDVSRHTVRAHWRNVYEKLDVSDKAAAVAAGFRGRLIL